MTESTAALDAAVPATPDRRDAGPGRLAGVSAIWVRELRARMRGKRAFIFLTFYLSVLGLLLAAALNAATSNRPLLGLEAVAFGRGVFASVLIVETLVVVVLGPAYTAGSISQEREKQTFDLLAVTPISSLAIVIGKLASGLSFLAVVVGASIPFAAVAFLFGGTAVEDLVIGYLILAVVGVGVGAIGVCCSAMLKKTQPATICSFIVVGLIAVGTPAAWLAMDADAADRGTPRPPVAMLYLNPFVAQADLLCSTSGNVCAFGGRFDQGNVPPPVPRGAAVDQGQLFDAVGPPPLVEPGTFWPVSVAAWAVTSLLVVVLAAQMVSPTRPWQIVGRRDPDGAQDPPADGIR